MSSSDAPRRSNRSNKGQNQGRIEPSQLYGPVCKRTNDNGQEEASSSDTLADGTAQNSEIENNIPSTASISNDENASQEIVRCPCGHNDDEDGFMLCCDRCQVWQHGDCVGIESDDQAPEIYFCEICRPDLHHYVPLKQKKIKPGITHDKHQRSLATIGHSRAGLKSRKRKSDSALGTKDSDDTEYSENQHPGVRPRAVEVRASSSKKTKQSAKHQNSKLAITDPIDRPAASPEQLQDSARRGVSVALSYLMNDLVALTTKEGSVRSPFMQPLELAMNIEFALYNEYCIKQRSLKTTDQYRQRWRAITFNLKDQKNPTLRANVLNGKTLPEQLVKLSSEEMANAEIKHFAEAVRQASTQSSVLKSDSGPRIRRTHKGEEIIGGEDSDYGLKDGVHEENTEVSDAEAQKEEILDEGDRQEVSSHSEYEDGSEDDNEYSVVSHAVELTQAPREVNIGEIDDPGLTAVLNKQEDFLPELTALEFDSVGDSWSGKLVMQGVGECSAVGTQVGGEPFDEHQWSVSICPNTLVILGRSDRVESAKYLDRCSGAPNRKLICLALRPASNDDCEEFMNIYSHFHERKRYGPFKARQSADIKDAYIVPLDPKDELPEYLLKMDNWKIESGRSNRLLIAVIVISKMLKARLVDKKQGSAELSLADPIMAGRGSDMKSTAVVDKIQTAPAASVTNMLYAINVAGASANPSAVFGSTQSNNFLPPIPQSLLSLGISNDDWRVLHGALSAHPEIANDPAKCNDPQVLQRLLMETYAQQIS